MKYLWLIVGVLFSFSPVGYSQTPIPQTGVLTGYVESAGDQEPVRNAWIFIHINTGVAGREDIVSKVPSWGGRFSISLQPGTYDVFVVASGFMPQCKSISIEAGKKQTYTPQLQVDVGHMEQSSTR